MLNIIKIRSVHLITLIFSIFVVSLLWLPLNVNPEFLSDLFSINFFRLISPLVLLFFIDYKKLYYKDIISLLILIQLISFISGFVNRGLNFDLYWPVLWIIASLFIYTSSRVNHLFYLSFFVVLFMSVVQIYILVDHMINNFTLLTYTITSYRDEYLGMPMVRATGISRNIGLIICFFTYILFEYYSSKKFIIITILSLLFFLIFLIFSLSSRGGLICTLIAIVCLLYFYRKNYKLVLLFLLTAFFSFFAFKISSYYLMDYEINLYNQKISQLNLIKDKISQNEFSEMLNGIEAQKGEDINQKISRRYDSGVTSGRIEIWSNVVESNSRVFLGGGSLYDKFLLNVNSSSIFVYVYASSGLIGVLLFILYIYNFLKYLFNNLNKKFIIHYSFLLFFFIRMIFENSFIIYGLDFILFMSAFSYILKGKKA